MGQVLQYNKGDAKLAGSGGIFIEELTDLI